MWHIWGQESCIQCSVDQELVESLGVGGEDNVTMDLQEV